MLHAVIPPCARQQHWLPGIAASLAMACAAPQTADPDIARPLPGAPPLERLPGPLLVFDSYQSALLAACQKIVTKPRATAGRRWSEGFEDRWRASTEYCAWIYYTPDGRYVLSKLTDQTTADPAHRSKRCLLPSYVDDRRFSPDSIKYIYALHNHLYDDMPSEDDVFAIVSEGFKHGFEAETKDGGVRLSIVAFFSNEVEAPRCDGFYQYIPLSGQILEWTHTTRWECAQTHRVEWSEGFERAAITEARAGCFEEASP